VPKPFDSLEGTTTPAYYVCNGVQLVKTEQSCYPDCFLAPEAASKDYSFASKGLYNDL
jgi:hypothetical protein